MEEQETLAIVTEPAKARIVCPDCQAEHDGSHGIGRQKGRIRLCAACFRSRRLAGLKRKMDEREEIIRRANEPRVVQVDFREWPELFGVLVADARMDVRTLEQQIIYCVKSWMED